MMQEQIIRTDYAEVMQKSYVDYAMSVIISRALPAVSYTHLTLPTIRLV